jgi:hypothetical protein
MTCRRARKGLWTRSRAVVANLTPDEMLAIAAYTARCAAALRFHAAGGSVLTPRVPPLSFRSRVRVCAVPYPGGIPRRQDCRDWRRLHSAAQPRLCGSHASRDRRGPGGQGLQRIAGADVSSSTDDPRGDHMDARRPPSPAAGTKVVAAGGRTAAKPGAIVITGERRPSMGWRSKRR